MKYDFDLENRKEARKQLIYKILLTVVEIAIVIFARVCNYAHWHGYIYRIRTEYGPDIKKRRQDLSQ